MIVKIYTDGACSGNPGPGGWGAVLIYGENIKEIFGGVKHTTNNRMEMMAVIKSLQELKRKDLDVEIYSDSNYVVNCFLQKWYIKWERNGWRTDNKKTPVANKELWEELITLYKSFNSVKFIKVKGHSGDRWNERADELAEEGVNLAKGMV